MAGYSTKPLVVKLGIAKGHELCTIGAFSDYPSLLEPLPEGVRIVSDLSRNTDIVHIFTSRKVELVEGLSRIRSIAKPTVTVWVSWPKKTSGVLSDISENTIREIAFPLDFVDVKVCAVTDVWSGLKLVVRKALR